MQSKCINDNISLRTLGDFNIDFKTDLQNAISLYFCSTGMLQLISRSTRQTNTNNDVFSIFYIQCRTIHSFFQSASTNLVQF